MDYPMRWQGVLFRAIDPFSLFEQRINEKRMERLIEKSVLPKRHIAKEGYRLTDSIRTPHRVNT